MYTNGSKRQPALSEVYFWPSPTDEVRHGKVVNEAGTRRRGLIVRCDDKSLWLLYPTGTGDFRAEPLADSEPKSIRNALKGIFGLG